MSKMHILFLSFILNITLGISQQIHIPDTNDLNKEIISIHVDDHYKNGNWEPLLEQVKDKRIVLLGEPNHGAKEIFVSRNDLIQSLHQKLGFQVILFESGIGELIAIDIQKETRTPSEMTYGFFSGWRTREFAELMQYIKSNNISISGFDVQRTGGTFDSLLKAELKRISINPDPFSDIEERFSDAKRTLTNRKAVYDSVQGSTKELIKDYKLLQSQLENTNNKLLNDTSHLIIRTIKNRIAYLDYFLDFVEDKNWNKRWKARDSMMYSNIDWLLKNKYKDQKVIVIAHNFHIARHNEKEEVLGEFLKKEYDSDMYSIGVFAGKGSFHNNYGQTESLVPISEEGLDIKHIIHQLKYRVSFLDIPNKANDHLKWLFTDIIINDTFIDLSSSHKMTLSKNFDGLLFIDKISPPENK